MLPRDARVGNVARVPGVLCWGAMTQAPCIIAIAGASCSGKSTLARALVDHLKDTTLLSLDSYYHDQRGTSDHDINVDVPESLDSALLTAHVVALSRGEKVEVPVYDFSTHGRTDDTCALVPGNVVIVEGLFSLYWPEVRAVLSGSVFMVADADACLARRIARDSRERGRSESSISHQFTHKVLPMYERYVAPTRRHAGVILSGTDPVATLVDHVVLEIERWRR